MESWYVEEQRPLVERFSREKNQNPVQARVTRLCVPARPFLRFKLERLGSITKFVSATRNDSELEETRRIENRGNIFDSRNIVRRELSRKMARKRKEIRE